VEVVAVEVVEVVVVMVWSWEVTAAMAMVLLPPLAVMQVSMEALLAKLVVLVAFFEAASLEFNRRLKKPPANLEAALLAAAASACSAAEGCLCGASAPTEVGILGQADANASVLASDTL
jgi:hypothetical protein